MGNNLYMVFCFCNRTGHLVYRNSVLDGTYLGQADVNFMMCGCVLPWEKYQKAIVTASASQFFLVSLLFWSTSVVVLWQGVLARQLFSFPWDRRLKSENSCERVSTSRLCLK